MRCITYIFPVVARSAHVETQALVLGFVDMVTTVTGPIFREVEWLVGAVSKHCLQG